jgi:hypothetical protein
MVTSGRRSPLALSSASVNCLKKVTRHQYEVKIVCNIPPFYSTLSMKKHRSKTIQP